MICGAAYPNTRFKSKPLHPFFACLTVISIEAQSFFGIIVTATDNNSDATGADDSCRIAETRKAIHRFIATFLFLFRLVWLIITLAAFQSCSPYVIFKNSYCSPVLFFPNYPISDLCVTLSLWQLPIVRMDGPYYVNMLSLFLPTWIKTKRLYDVANITAISL